jgi:hypothetical protein
MLCMIRLSLAEKPSDGKTTPGNGVKLLLDGMRSANFVAMHSLDDQAPEGDNFCLNQFQNHVDTPTPSIGGNYFEGIQNCQLSNNRLWWGYQILQNRMYMGQKWLKGMSSFHSN